MADDEKPELEHPDHDAQFEGEIEAPQLMPTNRKWKIPFWGLLAAALILLGGSALFLPRIIAINLAPATPTTKISTPTQRKLAPRPADVARQNHPACAFAESNLQQNNPSVTSTSLSNIMFSVVFDAEHTEDGLHTRSQFDFDIEQINVGENQVLPGVLVTDEYCLSHDNNQQIDNYMEFIIDHDGLFGVPPGKAYSHCNRIPGCR